MALNSMKFGFNLPFVLTTFIGMENKWTNPQKNTPQQQQMMKRKKQKQQNNFYAILQRISQIIDDLVNLQIRIKTNYMGIKAEKPSLRLKRLKSIDSKQTLISEQSNNSDSFLKKNLKKSILIQQQQKQLQKQQKIREILKKHMKTQIEIANNVCKTRTNPTQNLQRLSTKLDGILQKVKVDKQKQKRIWNNFYKKKTNQNHETENDNKFFENFNLTENKTNGFDQSTSFKTKNTFIEKLPQLFSS